MHTVTCMQCVVCVAVCCVRCSVLCALKCVVCVAVVTLCPPLYLLSLDSTVQHACSVLCVLQCELYAHLFTWCPLTAHCNMQAVCCVCCNLHCLPISLPFVPQEQTILCATFHAHVCAERGRKGESDGQREGREKTGRGGKRERHR